MSQAPQKSPLLKPLTPLSPNGEQTSLLFTSAEILGGSVREGFGARDGQEGCQSTTNKHMKHVKTCVSMNHSVLFISHVCCPSIQQLKIWCDCFDVASFPLTSVNFHCVELAKLGFNPLGLSWLGVFA